MNDVELTELYGPLAKHSEHKRGNRVTFKEGSHIHTGTIKWVGLSDPEESLSVFYVVDLDQVDGTPFVVFPSEIIEGD